jgi:hypothetical protein
LGESADGYHAPVRIVMLLAAVFVALIGIAAFGAFSGDMSLLIVAVICMIPVGFLISVLMRGYTRH